MSLFPSEPDFRWHQVERALFAHEFKGWDEVTTLPKAMRETLAHHMPWMTVKSIKIFESKNKDTYKAALEGTDGQRFESVLMENQRGQWTICVSSQVGCAMKCSFCATGTMGLKRSLTNDEIIDQYRFWKNFLECHPEPVEGRHATSMLRPFRQAQGGEQVEPQAQHDTGPQRISNVVFMGMGEPLANYENVKTTLRTWLAYTDLGPTRITVSTVGVLTQLERILTDPDWPHVRLAVSLHSADPVTRKEIVPTSLPDFLPKLADWAQRYFALKGNRRHHLTFEYVMLSGVNDTEHHAQVLADFVRSVGRVKINIIPYNTVAGKSFARSGNDQLEQFKEIVRNSGLDITQRRTMGNDIAAACGQLVILTS